MPGQYLINIEAEHYRAPRSGLPDDAPQTLRTMLALKEQPTWGRNRYVAAALRSYALELDGDATPAGAAAAFDKIAKRAMTRYEKLPATQSLAVGLLAEVAHELKVSWQPPLTIEV